MATTTHNCLCQIKQLRHTLPIRYKSLENREILADAKLVFGTTLGNFLVAYFQKSIGKFGGILKNRSQMCKSAKRVLLQKTRKKVTKLTTRALALRQREWRTADVRNVSFVIFLRWKFDPKFSGFTFPFSAALEACFLNDPTLFGSISGTTIPFISSQRRGSEPSNFAILLVFVTFKTC